MMIVIFILSNNIMTVMSVMLIMVILMIGRNDAHHPDGSTTLVYKINTTCSSNYARGNAVASNHLVSTQV